MLDNTDPLALAESYLTLDQLIEWLEKQPATRIYEYGNNRQCLLATFLTAKGITGVHMGSETWGVYGGGTNCLPKRFDKIAHGGDGAERTYGAALQRAYVEREKTNV